MSSTYADFTREPSKPHQCMHESDQDGRRCRATAMHNEFMCFHHRSEDIPTVIQNEPFLVETLLTREAVLQTLTTIAARLAANRIDLKRAALLIQTCQSAASNLTAQERQANAAARTNAAAAAQTAPATAATAQTAAAAAPTLPDAVIPNEGKDPCISLTPEPQAHPQTAAEPPVKPYSEYTTAEANHLSLTIILGHEPLHRPRPDTLTFQDVQNHLNARRKQDNMPPKQLINPATDSPHPATLPTLQAVATTVQSARPPQTPAHRPQSPADSSAQSWS